MLKKVKTSHNGLKQFKISIANQLKTVKIADKELCRAKDSHKGAKKTKKKEKTKRSYNWFTAEKRG